MPRRKLKMTKAAIAARRRYRAKKSGAGRSVGAGRGGFMRGMMSRVWNNPAVKAAKGRAFAAVAKSSKARAARRSAVDKRIASLEAQLRAKKKQKKGIKKKKKKVGSGWLSKVGNVPKCRTCRHRR